MKGRGNTTGSKRKRAENGTLTIRRSREEAEKLFCENKGLVFQTLKSMGLEPTDDRTQDGYVGLWIASLCFDESKKFKFSTYACRAIRNTLIRSWQVEQRSIQPELSLNQTAYFWDDDSQRELIETVEDPKCGDPVESEEFDIYLRQTLTETEISVAKMRADGKSYAKIGQAFGYTDMWVYLRLRDIKKKLKAEYAERKINLGTT